MDSQIDSHSFLYQLIRSMSSIMASSDIYTVHHQNNVSVLARLIAQEMGLTAFDVCRDSSSWPIT